MNRLFAVAVLVISALLGFLVHQFLQPQDLPPPAIDPESVIGQARPDFILQDLQGNDRSVAEWDGNVLVINFWATWCPPCRDEIPEFIHLQDKLGKQGVQFLGIALQTAEEVQPFYNELGMNYPTLVGQQDVIQVAKAYGNDLGALPYTVILDTSGKIVFTKRGPLPTDEARAILTPML